MVEIRPVIARLRFVGVAALFVAAGLGCEGAGGPERVEGTASFDAGMKPVLEAYLIVQEALAADRLEGVGEAARSLATAVARVDASAVTGPEAEFYRAIPEAAASAGEALAAADSLEEARERFLMLSRALAPWARNARPEGIDLVWCSMKPGGWMQRSGAIRNPYYGATMLACGEKVNSREYVTP